MKLPEIYGNNKIRDFKILQLFNDGMSETDIAISFLISQSRVSQIVYRNRTLLNADKELEKIKRINLIKRQIKKAGDSKKDVADLIDQLRVETEGNKVEHSGKIGGSQINVFPTKTIIFRDIDDSESGRDRDVYEPQSTESLGGQEKV